MSSLRENPIKDVAGLEMDKVMDCLDQSITNKEGKVDNGLPKSNVLKYYLEDGSWFAARPSGTEPKLKVYFSVVGDTREHCLDKLEKVEKEVLSIVNSIE